MDKQGASVEYDLHALRERLFGIAKAWFTRALLLQAAMGIAGVILVGYSVTPKLAPLVVLALAIGAEFCAWQSDAYRGKADGLLRKMDGRDSFGWPISSREIADLEIRCGRKMMGAVRAKAPAETYFASQQQHGPRRALENVRETAWWSKHLVRRTLVWCLIGVGVLVALSLVALLLSVQTITDTSRLSAVGKMVASSLMLVFSLGLLRTAVAYHGFANRADQIEAAAHSMLEGGDLDQISAVKLMHEYQVARACAPLIPDWVYHSMQDDLNRSWQTYASGFRKGTGE